ncbi:MAG: SGNH/GDSL hydrolase family protein [Gammaproteobacteria bacterium]
METATEKRRFGTAKTIIFSLLPTLVLLISAEVVLRIHAEVEAEAERGKALPPLAERNLYQQEDPVLGYSLMPGYSAKGIEINSLGFRGAEIERRKPPNTFRIVSIGDSTTFGLAGAQCPYPAQLQQLLAERSATKRVEVINGGVEGYNSVSALRLLEHRVAELQPDLITVFVGWNDIYNTDPFRANLPALHRSLTRTDATRAVGNWAGATAGLLDKLYLARFIRRIIFLEAPRMRARMQAVDSGKGRSIHPHMTAQYRSRLEGMVAFIRETGAKPVLMTLPTVLSDSMNEKALGIVHYPVWAQSDHALFLDVVKAFNSTIREVTGFTGATLVDNSGFIDSLGSEKEKLFFDSLHMYCEGNSLLARNIHRELKYRNLMPVN